MATMPKAGMTGQWETTVEEGLLAAQVGSGEVRVLATPMMIMGMERTLNEELKSSSSNSFVSERFLLKSYSLIFILK